MTAEDEKNLAAFKKLTGETSDGACLKKALAEYATMKKENADLCEQNYQYYNLCSQTFQAIKSKEKAEEKLRDLKTVATRLKIE